MIPADDCYFESSPSSQFMSFYRKSCMAQQYGGGDSRGSEEAQKTDRFRNGNGNNNNNSRCSTVSSAAAAQCKLNQAASACLGNPRSQTLTAASSQNKTTKSERRRMVKRERERGVLKDKRIRMMLRSDFSEEDELLYRCFNR